MFIIKGAKIKFFKIERIKKMVELPFKYKKKPFCDVDDLIDYVIGEVPLILHLRQNLIAEGGKKSPFFGILSIP